MQPDKWYLSYRCYIVVVGVIATLLRIFTDIELTEQQQDEIARYIESLVPAILAGLALISKLREQYKHKKTQTLN